MTYLEANRILASFPGGPILPLILCMSGTPTQLELFLRAAAAKRGHSLRLTTLPFDTLGQYLVSHATADSREVFLIAPWDLVRALDWRLGLPTYPVDARALDDAHDTIRRVGARRAPILYLDAPIPPAGLSPSSDAGLALYLAAAAAAQGARPLGPGSFALSSYLASGSPIAGPALGSVADAIVAAVLDPVSEPRKVLVTDLDQTLWRGVVAEDGVNGIQCAPEGPGFRHYIYQTILRKLKGSGVVLAAVTRNSPEDAFAALAPGRMVLGEPDFVTVIASYHAKSAQIASLSRHLNIGPEQFVYVDDNPIEIEEVAGLLPAVTCLRFPVSDNELPAFLARIQELFRRESITDEDRQRTEMYRRMTADMAPSAVPTRDLRSFLAGLEMGITVFDRSLGHRARAVQLINKTNQFNLNGRRIDDAEIDSIVRDGGRLYTATLRDRVGDHGEILALLMDQGGMVKSFVMSCRVFQRKVEYAFLCWLLRQGDAPLSFEFASTSRNEPFRAFVDDGAFELDQSGRLRLSGNAFLSEHAEDLALFQMSTISKEVELVD